MHHKKRVQRALFLLLVTSACFSAQVKLSAENADTFIAAEYASYCEEIGGEYGICPELLEAIMESESSGNPQAQNGNCKGLMQINMLYHKDRMQKLGIEDIYDAKGNIMLAADYLAELFRKHGDIGTVLMVYNGSRDAIMRGKQADYTEYAEKIMKRSEQLERQHRK
ncbi:MAG: lytic transglycosylase domain-containing protein [Eubacterium sp.]|jgi:soluble lytic murein transglycosylase-like protein|nr:lytic transglycosylase domain-containing protein [Eubacterium sp.]NBI85019.1 lytic transglycosylase domain-containing protein [Lachnospiraceae bacterium]